MGQNYAISQKWCIMGYGCDFKSIIYGSVMTFYFAFFIFITYIFQSFHHGTKEAHILKCNASWVISTDSQSILVYLYWHLYLSITPELMMTHFSPTTPGKILAARSSSSATHLINTPFSVSECHHTLRRLHRQWLSKRPSNIQGNDASSKGMNHRGTHTYKEQDICSSANSTQ